MVTVKKNFIHQLYIYIFIEIKFICDIIQLLRMHYLLFDRMYIYFVHFLTVFSKGVVKMLGIC